MAVTIDELLVYLREADPSPEMVAALEQILDIANGLVDEVTVPLDPEPARVRAIRLEVAARAWRNPEGHQSSAIDDYQWAGGTGRGGVHLTDAERAELRALSTPDDGPIAGSLPYQRSW